MKRLYKILRKKTLYASLLTIYLVGSAMSFNRTHQQERLATYYDRPGLDPKVSIKNGHEKINLVHATNPIDYTDNTQELIKYALSYQGTPYKYGGKGPKNFDCSGFTSFVFRKFEINLPPSSRLQSQVGTSVTKADLRPGDLVFFKSPTKGVERIGHVGLVIEASQKNIKFIHSSTGRGVIVDDLLHSAHYTARYRSARRVL